MMSLCYGFHFPVQMVQPSVPTLLNSFVMGVVVEEARIIPLPLMRKCVILLQNFTPHAQPCGSHPDRGYRA